MGTSNKIIVNNTNAMIKWTNCPKLFWVPAIETVVYIENCTISKAIATTSTDGEVTPYEPWCYQKPNI